MITLLSMLVAPALAADDTDFRSNVDQAKFFLKKEWYDDAERELEQAIATPSGKVDAEAWFLLARVRFHLADFAGARDAASRAHSYSRDDAQLQAAAQFSDYLIASFGVVELRSALPGVNTGLDVDLTSVVFDPELKAYVTRLVERFDGKKSKVDLPFVIGLPGGTYTINGRTVDVTAGSEQQLELTASEIIAAPLTSQLAQGELGIGVSAWFGEDVTNLQPSPVIQVALTQPIYIVALGVMADWSPRTYNTQGGGADTVYGAWSLGGRVGVDLYPAESLHVRPSVGYRYGYLPGLERACERDGDQFRCGDDAEPELFIYGVGRAHMPMAELVVDYVTRGRTTSLGVGFKVSGEYAIGLLPAQATAQEHGAGAELLYGVDASDRAFSAVGIRGLLHLSLAF